MKPESTKFLMTPEQIMARAQQQKASADPETQKLGAVAEALAAAIEWRLSMSDLRVLQTKLDNAQRRVRTLIVIGMRPNLTDEKREIVRQLERSARAEVKLRIKAMEYAKTQAR